MSTGPYKEHTSRAVEWLCGEIKDDGSLAGAYNLAAYYKLPAALARMNRIAQGNKILDWTSAHYQDARGHFNCKIIGQPGSRYCDLYEDLWLAWGAQMLGRRDYVEKIFSFASTYFDPGQGGFRSSVSATGNVTFSEILDLRSTALGGIVALYVGRKDIAYRTADFVLQMLSEQLNPHREFFLLRNLRTGQMVPSLLDVPERFMVIKRGIPRPLYYALGFAIILLAQCAAVRHDVRYFKGAERYADICMAFAPESLFHDYSGKLCWGFSLLTSGETGRGFLETAKKIGDHLCDRQSPLGYWESNELEADRDRTLGLTAEYTLWLDLVGENLALYQGTK